MSNRNARVARTAPAARKSSKLDQKLALALHKECEVEVERFDAKPEVYESGKTRVGFVYLTVHSRRLGIPLWSARGIKIWLSEDNKISLQFREERGTDGKYRPYFFLRNAELRALITLMVQRDQDVVAGIERASELRSAPEEESSAEDALDAALEGLEDSDEHSKLEDELENMFD
jgi:hypothetical protein